MDQNGENGMAEFKNAHANGTGDFVVTGFLRAMARHQTLWGLETLVEG